MDLKRIQINNIILILAVLIILFQLFGAGYIRPKMLKIMQETDHVARGEMVKSLMLNPKFIVWLLLGALSSFILPAYFFIKNWAVFPKKWIPIILMILVYLFNLAHILAVICLGFYLWKIFQEIQDFRKQKII